MPKRLVERKMTPPVYGLPDIRRPQENCGNLSVFNVAFPQNFSSDQKTIACLLALAVMGQYCIAAAEPIVEPYSGTSGPSSGQSARSNGTRSYEVIPGGGVARAASNHPVFHCEKKGGCLKERKTKTPAKKEKPVEKLNQVDQVAFILNDDNVTFSTYEISEFFSTGSRKLVDEAKYRQLLNRWIDEKPDLLAEVFDP